MRHASFFSGVGGLDLGFERAGIETVSVSEIDSYACAVLAERFPDAPNLGSITEVDANDIPEADIWSGGFPCQDLSVAGKRAGFAGKRSSLAFTFLDLVEQRRPRWLVLENVPGLFSSNKGADFGRLLYEMEQLGYCVSWRTLDARYFGVPQRRRRVFIVGHLGGRGAAEVLLEPEGVRRDPATGREAGQEVAGTLGGGSGSRGWAQDTDRMTFVPVVANTLLANGGDRHLADAQAGHLSPQHTGTVTTAFDAKNYSNLQEVLSGSVIPVAFAENQRGEVYLSDYQQALTGGGGKPGQGYAAVLAFNGFNGIDMQPSTDVTPTVRAQHIGAPQVLEGGSLAVRRLTPRECERLMGWPDDWTRYADDGAEIADSHRYRMCGNGVVGPVAEWIGRRIVEVEQ